MTTTATMSPSGEVAERLAHRRDLAAHRDGGAARRRARARDRRDTWSATPPRSSPATFAVSVTMRCPLMRSYSPTIGGVRVTVAQRPRAVDLRRRDSG